MFTGLVECTGRILSLTYRGRAGVLQIRPDRPLERPVRGESIAVNGTCLTLTEFDPSGRLSFDVLSETLSRTNLEGLGAGGTVNLERALKVGDRLGGHWVTGHVDCCGRVTQCGRSGDDFLLEITMEDRYAPYVVEKGSIAVDGVSLTVAECLGHGFSCRLIPTTLEETALKERLGKAVNLEFDVLGKYVLRSRELAGKGTAVTMDTLREAGFL